MLKSFSKLELVQQGRRMGITMGDYARASKDELIELFQGREQAAYDGLVNFKASALLDGATPAPVQPVARQFIAPTYEHINVVESLPAQKVFGSKAKALEGLMVEIWNDPAAPKVMQGYRFNPKHLQMALTAIARQRPVWLGGPAGTGKTEFVKQLCARLGRAFIRVQFDASLEAYHIIGGERVKAASTVWQDGLVLQGFRRPGAIILLDEVGFARAEYTSALHAAIEPNSCVTVPETGEVVERAKGVCFFAADNSNGRGDATGVYAGIREQNNAFLNRFARFINFTYLGAAEEAEIVADQTGCPAALAMMVAEFIAICRGKAESGALESPPTMREAFYLAEALVDGIPSRDAFETTVVNRSPIDCQEILQQIFIANVDQDMINKALAGEIVTLKSKIKVDNPSIT
jgi:MoxR-like ATPase